MARDIRSPAEAPARGVQHLRPGEVIALLDPRGVILAVSEAWERFPAAGDQAVGVGADYIASCAEAEGTGATWGPAAAAGIRRVLAGGPVYAAEYQRAGTAETRWFQIVVTPLGACRTGALVTHVDVTDQKAAAGRPAELAATYRLIVEGTADMLSTHAADGTFLYVSQACRRLLGYEPDEMTGRPVFRFVHPEDQAKAHLRRFATGELAALQTVAIRWRCRNGDYLWMESSVSRLPHRSDDEQRTVVVSRDISERKLAEQEQSVLRSALERAASEWRSTFDASGLPIIIFNLEGRVRRINRAARERLGADYREIIGRAANEIGIGQPWEAMAPLVQRVLETSLPENCEAMDEKGSTWELEGSLSVASDHKEPRIIVQVRDISDTVKLQESLRRSETMAALGSVVAGVAHEVRNPLFGISAVLDAFEARCGQRPEYRDYLPMLRSELTRMTELMQALLDYGRPPRLEMVPHELDDTVAAALQACRPLAVRREVELRPRLAAAGHQVLLDRAHLTQALKNIIENAVQHSAPGGEVTVDVEPVTIEGKTWVRVAVKDRGPGFRPIDLPKVFEPFYSRRSGGTGLGLSIVQRVVDEHGGRVRAGNRPTGGALIELDLPTTTISPGG